MSDPIKVRAALSAGLCVCCGTAVFIACPECAYGRCCGHESLCRFTPVPASSLRELVERPGNPFAAELGSDPGDERGEER